MEAIYEFASRQGGLISRQQALGSSITRHQIERFISSGRWTVVLPRVYKISGTPVDPNSLLIALTLGYPEAAISHLSAAYFLELIGWKPDWTEITSMRNQLVRLKGVVAHRTSIPLKQDITTISNIRTTTPTRTLVDLAEHLSPEAMLVAIEKGLRSKKTSIYALNECYERVGRRRGRKRFRPFVEALAAVSPASEQTESHLEDQLLATIRRNWLPAPVPQYWVKTKGRRFRLDFAYPELKVAIEADGYAYHSDRSSFKNDRERDNLLRVAGWQVLRFTADSGDTNIVEGIRAALTTATAIHVQHKRND